MDKVLGIFVYMDFLTWSFPLHVFEFTIGIGMFFFDSPFEINLNCGIWIVSPRKISHDSLSTH
jgi:hypothetical protein